MPRIPDAELDRLKRGTDLAALVRAKGVDLKLHGTGHLIGRCPFHDDQTPSLVVTPGKNLFHCLGCGAGGSVIDFLMRKDGLSFRHAVEVLRAPSAAAFATTKATVPKLPPPVAFDADDQTLLRQVVAYYHARLKETPAALAYLQKRGIGTEETVSTFQLGFADRTLGLRLPGKSRVAGADIRARLEKLGLYRASGHEHFNGCVVFPVLDAGGDVLGLYGRKIVERQTPGLPKHLYLPGPHRGVWNPACLSPPALAASGGAVILCEAVIDALTFWTHGHRHVTTAYGVEGFTEETEDAIVRANVRQVFIAYDRDEAGERGAAKAAARLQARGVECRRVLFPHGLDANEYARKVQPPNQALGLLLNGAEWLGKGRGVAPAPVDAGASSGRGAVVPTSAGVDAHARAPSLSSSLAAKDKAASPASTTTPGPEEAAKKESSVPAVASGLQPRGEHWFAETDGREWRVGGLEKTLGTDALKVTLRLRVGDCFHLDSLDLAKDSERRRFVERAAEETGLHADLLKRDLARLLLAAEQAQAELARPAETLARTVTLTPEERAEALQWLQAPDLIGRLKSALARVGIIGEEKNALLAYLAGVSRKLERPLAVIIQSASAAGKTTLMDAVLGCFPEEERVKYSAMTGQSLYYLGETNLKNKILAIVEEAGAEKAGYALKLLQSEGELTIASTGKDPATGRMETQEYHVEGPVMIMLTTTAIDLDEELQNRCLTLAVDESPEQTARIHALQRERRTLAGLAAKAERAALLRVLRNAQRLLAPVEVLNPFAPALTFPSGRARHRRDHEKYLTLIDAIALLHQHQRPRGRHEQDGRALEYVAATLDDIALANALAPEALGRSLDELPPQTRRLLTHIRAVVRTKKGGTFTRRELREACGWSLTQTRAHLARLVDLELLALRPGKLGGAFCYELLADADTPEQATAVGLIDVDQLRAAPAYDAGLAGPTAGGGGGMADTVPPALTVLPGAACPKAGGVADSHMRRPREARAS
jgi:DNA primase